MGYKRLISSLLLFSVAITAILSGPGCANIIPPQGGPRDSIPPVLLKATPGDSTRNFTGNKISFVFDEYVDLQSVQENLMVSPSPRINPTVTFRLNTVTVKLADSLESNTTYSINFGNAIKDYTEGNPLKNFTYTFSTGRYIDSLELTGNVILAETGKIDTTLFVILHTSADDSAVMKEKPRYVTRLDSKGNFIFKNLPPKNFYLYALQDEGGTRRYFDTTKLFAFAGKPVVPAIQSQPITLYAYAAKKTSQPADKATSSSSGTNPLKGLGNKNKASGAERLRYTTSLTNNQQDLLSRFTINFTQPLRSFDSTKIRLYTDSIFTPAPAYSFKEDSTHKVILLTHTWKENTLYHIILDKDFAEDSLGKKLLKTDTLSFTTKKLADYGSLQLKFRNLDMKKNPVLILLSGETVVRSVVLTGDSFSESSFLPGEYELRILYDDNKNGVWDPGQFFGKHQQPELVKPIERRITVKPNWQNEFEIAL